jgi:hypothetical protein
MPRDSVITDTQWASAAALPCPIRDGTGSMRFPGTQGGALARTLAAEHPVAARRPTFPGAIVT